MRVQGNQGWGLVMSINRLSSQAVAKLFSGPAGPKPFSVQLPSPSAAKTAAGREFSAGEIIEREGPVGVEAEADRRLRTALVARLREAESRGQVFKAERGEIRLGPDEILVIGSNLSPEEARDHARQQGEDLRRVALGVVQALYAEVRSEYSETPNLAREQFEANRARAITVARQQLEEQFGFRGGEIERDEEGRLTLGAWSLSFQRPLEDWNGRDWSTTVQVSGRGRPPIELLI